MRRDLAQGRHIHVAAVNAVLLCESALHAFSVCGEIFERRSAELQRVGAHQRVSDDMDVLALYLRALRRAER